MPIQMISAKAYKCTCIDASLEIGMAVCHRILLSSRLGCELVYSETVTDLITHPLLIRYHNHTEFRYQSGVLFLLFENCKDAHTLTFAIRNAIGIKGR